MTVLCNELGEDTGTPTAVSFGDERLVGTEAEEHLQVGSKSSRALVLCSHVETVQAALPCFRHLQTGPLALDRPGSFQILDQTSRCM